MSAWQGKWGTQRKGHGLLRAPRTRQNVLLFFCLTEPFLHPQPLDAWWWQYSGLSPWKCPGKIAWSNTLVQIATTSWVCARAHMLLLLQLFDTMQLCTCGRKWLCIAWPAKTHSLSPWNFYYILPRRDYPTNAKRETYVQSSRERPVRGEACWGLIVAFFLNNLDCFTDRVGSGDGITKTPNAGNGSGSNFFGQIVRWGTLGGESVSAKNRFDPCCYDRQAAMHRLSYREQTVDPSDMFINYPFCLIVYPYIRCCVLH